MKRKMVIGAIILLLLLCGGVFILLCIVPHTYVIPYKLTELYGEDIEEMFPLGKLNVDGESFWNDCQRDEDNNLVITATLLQNKHNIQYFEGVFNDWWKYDLLYEGCEVEYNENYTEMYVKCDTENIDDFLPEYDIHYMLIGYYAYQVFTGHEDNMVTAIIEDEDGNKYAEKHFTNFPSDVECYEILPEQSLSLEDIEESGEYEAINLNYDGNYEVIATPEQYEKLTQKSEVKEAANKKNED